MYFSAADGSNGHTTTTTAITRRRRYSCTKIFLATNFWPWRIRMTFKLKLYTISACMYVYFVLFVRTYCVFFLNVMSIICWRSFGLPASPLPSIVTSRIEKCYYPCVPYTYVVTTYTTSRVSAYRFTRNPYTKATHSHGTAEGEINTPVQRYITIGRVPAMAVKRGRRCSVKDVSGATRFRRLSGRKIRKYVFRSNPLWGHWSTTITPVPRGQ